MPSNNINHLDSSKQTSSNGRYPDKIRTLPLFNGAFDAYKMSAENCEILFASYSAGSKVAEHSHETENHGVVTRGELILSIDDSVKRYAVGDWYHVPAGTVHQADFEKDTDTIELWFSVEDE